MNWRKLFAWCVFAVPVGLVLWWFGWSWECALADWSWPRTRDGALHATSVVLGVGASSLVAAVCLFFAGWWFVDDAVPVLLRWAGEPWRKDDPSKPRTF